jgi:hypothetical protein
MDFEELEFWMTAVRDYNEAVEEAVAKTHDG